MLSMILQGDIKITWNYSNKNDNGIDFSTRIRRLTKITEYSKIKQKSKFDFYLKSRILDD